MKRNYWIITGLILAVTIIVFVVMVLVLEEDDNIDTTESPKEGSGIEYLEEMQLNPTMDYVNELEQIIRTDSDPYVRERGIFTLTDIAIREGDTDQIIDFLKEIANTEPEDNVRTAAYANVDLIRKSYPLPARGSLEISLSGDIKKGGEVSIISEIMSSTEVKDVVVGIEKLHKNIDPLSIPVINVALQPNQPLITQYDLRLIETGTYVIPFTLMLGFDRVDSETIQQEIHLTVNEIDGNYYVTNGS